MVEAIRYCANGCTRPDTEGRREPVHATHGNLCSPCAARLERHLTEIPERYALLPDYLLPSADLDRNPESKATKRPTAPVPLRLAALDLLDTRLGRRGTLGDLPTTDRRGALGTLLAIANEIRDNRGSNTKHESHVLHEADYLRNSLDTLTNAPDIQDICTEIRSLHRELGEAVGQYPPRPVGTCYLPISTEGQDESECGGPLIPFVTGVRCLACDAHWDQTELRRLGLLLTEDQAS